MDTQTNKTSELGNLTIKDVFFKYVRFLPVFLISVSICLLAAYLYLRYTTPIYRATGTISFVSEGNRNDRFEQIFKANQTEDILAEMEILRSTSLMERVINKAGLQTNYSAIGKIKSLNIYKNSPFRLDIFELTDSSRYFSMAIEFDNQTDFKINNENQTFKTGQVFKNVNGVFRISNPGNSFVGKKYSVSWTPAAMLAPSYASMIRVSPKVAGSMIYNISTDNTNVLLGADIVNNLIDEYRIANIEYRNITTMQTLNFISDRMLILENDLDSVERRLLQFKQFYDIIDMEEQSRRYFEKIAEADKIQNEYRMNLKVVDLIEEYLSGKNNLYEKVPSSLGISNESFQKLVGEYNLKVTERKILLEEGTKPENLVVKNLEGQINDIRIAIFESLKSTKQLFQALISDATGQGGTARYELKFLPQRAKELLEIEREKDIKQRLYNFLLEKREETAMSKASTIPNSKILSYAAGDPNPIKPNRRAVQILAIILGIGLPAMFIFFQEIINDKVYTRFDIEKITSASILGEVGHSYSSSSMIVSKTNRSMVSEQFRIIRSNLQYVLNKVEKPVIMVTSSFSAEGKSFIATNLGGVMALAGKKTAVLEFDIRKPKLFSGLKLSFKTGITNFLVGKTALEDLPVKVPGFENLYAISCGPVPPNPAELLLDPAVEQLFIWLKENFDVIIMDTAPVGMVSDAMTLGKFADSTLYIVRQGRTYKKQIVLIDEFYEEQRLPKISIILNDIKIKPGYGYYGYGRYGYGYGYGGGYYDTDNDTDVPKPVIMLNKF
ncbi:MAG TPA: polysaccharide biosynthesis tyrosine autokinase, partial [Chitinophagaceae bacterium]|nr:polysaccharide biosynthesis tyrosine autokinase [Chitinophagaceae bacterium]